MDSQNPDVSKRRKQEAIWRRVEENLAGSDCNEEEGLCVAYIVSSNLPLPRSHHTLTVPQRQSQIIASWLASYQRVFYCLAALDKNQKESLGGFCMGDGAARSFGCSVCTCPPGW